MNFKHQIRPADFLLSVQFAKDCINSVMGQLLERKQADFLKAFDDIVSGKVCEFAVFREMHMITHPDLTVTCSRKSYAADLESPMLDHRIHVKSCRSTSSFPVSWVFQPNDPLTTDPDPMDYLALCVNFGSWVEFDFLPAFEAVDFELYKPPLKPGLDKKVIYLEDLLRIGTAPEYR